MTNLKIELEFIPILEAVGFHHVYLVVSILQSSFFFKAYLGAYFIKRKIYKLSKTREFRISFEEAVGDALRPKLLMMVC